MQKNQVLSENISHSVSSSVRDVQIRIANLYRELSELEPGRDTRADVLIQSVRLLESELVGLRMAQPGHYL